MTRLADRLLESVKNCENVISKTKTIEHITTQPLRERNLDEALKNSVMMVRRTCDDVTIDLKIQSSAAQVVADDFLELLFITILENACEHNSREDRCVWVVLNRQHQGYEVAISDNGPGIPDEMKGNLFDPTCRSGGMGLHMVHHLVEKYGGHIAVGDRVPGKPDEGAQFRIGFQTPSADEREPT